MLALAFGVLVLAGGDWIPGGITVVAALTGLVAQIRVIRRLCAGPAASSPTRAAATDHRR